MLYCKYIGLRSSITVLKPVSIVINNFAHLLHNVLFRFSAKIKRQRIIMTNICTIFALTWCIIMAHGIRQIKSVTPFLYKILIVYKCLYSRIDRYGLFVWR